jgi:anaerobic magnesium-protoporphyrin IX monomethyl ester cyclase
MNKILFTHSYFLCLDPKQWALGQPYPPLGTLYAASLLRENGFSVVLFDSMFANSPDEVIPKIKAYQPDIFVIYDDGFNYLTKMCLTNMREAAFQMCRLAKERGCTVIVSSSDATDRSKEYLSAGADFILIGEGEFTLLELVRSIINKEGEPGQIPGLAFLKENVLLKTGPRPLLKDLDKLPLPAWDLVDMDAYRRKWKSHTGIFSMNMSTTRGCPFKCNWCAKPIYGNRYHARSPENVVGELVFLKEKYGFDHIWFCDDIFGLKPGWIKEFSILVRKAKLDLKFKIQARADLLLREADVEALAEAGCENCWIGAESGSQKILDAMDKGITVNQIMQATGLLKKHGIRPSFFIQFGYPGEKIEDIDLTIKMINRLLPFEIGISVSYPLPGTVFYDKVSADLKEKTNWKDSDDLALMFRNSFRPVFYKRLHSYVHKNYRKHLAYESLHLFFSGPSGRNLNCLKKIFSVLYYIPITYMERVRLKQLQKL